MNILAPNADFYAPDHASLEKALARTSNMGIFAHQDDNEIAGYHGILDHYPDLCFFAVVATDGSGSPRTGKYADYTPEQMTTKRQNEQKEAARVGGYSGVMQLNYPSSIVKNPKNDQPLYDIRELISVAKPSSLYTHNLADKHPTHVAVACRVIQALRMLPKEDIPDSIIGCEVWRDLDWLPDERKVPMDVSESAGCKKLAQRLLEVYDSQIAGGKRYDLATMGRRLANATYFASHGVDEARALIYGIDLKPLIENSGLDPREYLSSIIDRFRAEVNTTLDQVW